MTHCILLRYDEARFKHLYTESCRMLRNGYDDTEEKLLNVLFEGAWRPLPVGYNLQKRCFVRNRNFVFPLFFFGVM